MQITDFPQDTTHEYGKLKSVLARAVSETKGHTNKMIWLNLVLDAAQTAAAAPSNILIDDWPQDDNSENSVPDLLRQMSNALARNSTKGAADNTLLTAIFAAADTALNA